jgi:catechol 2,3-dioxygenase-like lactoylglutathione lyase family enzyme
LRSYRVLDSGKSEDFYVNKLRMKKVGEMDLSSATNHFCAFEADDPSQPMLELTHNHDRTETYDKGDGYAHVAFTIGADAWELGARLHQPLAESRVRGTGRLSGVLARDG